VTETKVPWFMKDDCNGCLELKSMPPYTRCMSCSRNPFCLRKKKWDRFKAEPKTQEIKTEMPKAQITLPNGLLFWPCNVCDEDCLDSKPVNCPRFRCILKNSCNECRSKEVCIFCGKKGEKSGDEEDESNL
jgi:hypothetical protein